MGGGPLQRDDVEARVDEALADPDFRAALLRRLGAALQLPATPRTPAAKSGADLVAAARRRARAGKDER